jgi:ABC-type transport system substrate-binding protein
MRRREMLKSTKWALLSGFMLVSLVVTACQGQEVQVPVTVVVRETQQVEVIQTQIVSETQIVNQTQVVEVEAEAFSRPHPILSDLRVRQAITYCANRNEMLAAVYAFLDDPSNLRMDSFIPTTHWAHASGLDPYEFDATKGMALLDEAGWTLAEGADIRSNEAGDALSLKFTTTNAAFRQTWGAVFVANMAACGIQVVPLYAPASWWFGDTTGIARRDYELGAFAWVGQADPGGVSLYACDQIPLPSNGWEGQMPWAGATKPPAPPSRPPTTSWCRKSALSSTPSFSKSSTKTSPASRSSTALRRTPPTRT